MGKLPRSRSAALRPRHQAGISLIEIMVAVVIGVITVLAMLQLLGTFEGSKRTTTAGADAQNSGVIALYRMQGDIRQSGFGFTWPALFICNLNFAAGGTVPFVPVIINPNTSLVPAGDANTDTLLVMYGNANSQPQGNPISSQTGNDYSVQSAPSFAVGDLVVAAPDSCSANLLLRPVSAVAATTITAASGPGTTMYNLGPSPAALAYAIRDGNLTVCNYVTTNCGVAKASVTAAVWAATWVPIANNVVSMRAQYGVDTSTPMDATVDAYNQTTPTTSCGWSRVSAVRIALVARNNVYNKTNPDGTNVTSAAPVWDGSADAPIDLSANSEWNHYRYKVFQSVVPMRNLVWLGAQSGC